MAPNFFTSGHSKSDLQKQLCAENTAEPAHNKQHGLELRKGGVKKHNIETNGHLSQSEITELCSTAAYFPPPIPTLPI